MFACSQVKSGIPTTLKTEGNMDANCKPALDVNQIPLSSYGKNPIKQNIPKRFIIVKSKVRWSAVGFSKRNIK